MQKKKKGTWVGKKQIMERKPETGQELDRQIDREYKTQKGRGSERVCERVRVRGGKKESTSSSSPTLVSFFATAVAAAAAKVSFFWWWFVVDFGQ